MSEQPERKPVNVNRFDTFWYGCLFGTSVPFTILFAWNRLGVSFWVTALIAARVWSQVRFSPVLLKAKSHCSNQLQFS